MFSHASQLATGWSFGRGRLGSGIAKAIHATETAEQSKAVVDQVGPTGTVVLAQSGRRGAGGEGGEGGEGGDAGASRPLLRPSLFHSTNRGLTPSSAEIPEWRAARVASVVRDPAVIALRLAPVNRRETKEEKQGSEVLNTRYIFGFTEGADTERAREKEIENDTQGRLGKRSGTYTALG